MTSREVVRRAIELDRPPRIPYAFLMPVRSDFFETAALDAALRSADVPRPAMGEIYCDEWGVHQRVTGGSWDEVIDHPLADLRAIDACRLPDVASRARIARLAPFLDRARRAGKYVVAADPVLAYERLAALVGFEQLLTASYLEPERLGVLLDRLTDLTVAAVEEFGRLGTVDGFMTWQDLASQTGLHVKLETFRALYKPRYARAVAAAHRCGMHFLWHVCGQALDLIPELIEIGVDVVQLDQPRLLGHRTLAERFGGRICFWNAVDIQWAAGAAVSPAALRAEVAEMTRPFRGLPGGIMVRHYPQPAAIGLSAEFHELSVAAFLENGCGLGESGGGDP